MHLADAFIQSDLQTGCSSADQKFKIIAFKRLKSEHKYGFHVIVLQAVTQSRSPAGKGKQSFCTSKCVHNAPSLHAEVGRSKTFYIS